MTIAETMKGARLDGLEQAVEQQTVLSGKTGAALADLVSRQQRFGMEMTRFIGHRLAAERELFMELAAHAHTGRVDEAMRHWSAFVTHAAEDYARASRRLGAIALGRHVGEEGAEESPAAGAGAGKAG